MKLPPTDKRVEKHTHPKKQQDIYNNTIARIEHALQENNLERELERLKKEWDTERVLETNAACLLLISLLLGTLLDKRWLWLTGGVAAFLLQHAFQGWCPPLPIIRALGVRTFAEISTERMAIKALRGDFSQIKQTADSAFYAAKLE